jgi:hypothetical protein
MFVIGHIHPLGRFVHADPEQLRAESRTHVRAEPGQLMARGVIQVDQPRTSKRGTAVSAIVIGDEHIAAAAIHRRRERVTRRTPQRARTTQFTRDPRDIHPRTATRLHRRTTDRRIRLPRRRVHMHAPAQRFFGRRRRIQVARTVDPQRSIRATRITIILPRLHMKEPQIPPARIEHIHPTRIDLAHIQIPRRIHRQTRRETERDRPSRRQITPVTLRRRFRRTARTRDLTQVPTIPVELVHDVMVSVGHIHIPRRRAPRIVHRHTIRRVKRARRSISPVDRPLRAETRHHPT